MIVKQVKFIILLLSALILGSCVNDEPEDYQSYVAVGDRLPNFAVVMNDGREVTHSMLMGEPALIVFFTTKCGDCRAFLLVLQEVHEREPELVMVLISRDEDDASVSEYWDAHHLTLPYSAQEDAGVYHLFAGSGVPRAYAVNSRGTVTAAWDDSYLPDADTLITILKQLEKED